MSYLSRYYFQFSDWFLYIFEYYIDSHTNREENQEQLAFENSAKSILFMIHNMLGSFRAVFSTRFQISFDLTIWSGRW